MVRKTVNSSSAVGRRPAIPWDPIQVLTARKKRVPSGGSRFPRERYRRRYVSRENFAGIVRNSIANSLSALARLHRSYHVRDFARQCRTPRRVASRTDTAVVVQHTFILLLYLRNAHSDERVLFVCIIITITTTTTTTTTATTLTIIT